MPLTSTYKQWGRTPSKSDNFACNKKATLWLDRTLWEHIQAKIEVVKDFRYLGAHLTTKNAATSPTIEKRWDKAMQQLKKLRYCPATVEAKAKAILVKVMLLLSMVSSQRRYP